MIEVLLVLSFEALFRHKLNGGGLTGCPPHVIGRTPSRPQPGVVHGQALVDGDDRTHESLEA